MFVNRNYQLLFKLLDANIQTSTVKLSFKFTPFLIATYTGEFLSGCLQFAITRNLFCQELSQTMALFFSLMRNTRSSLMINSLLRLLNWNKFKLKIANLRLLNVVMLFLYRRMPLDRLWIGIFIALRFCRVFFL